MNNNLIVIFSTSIYFCIIPAAQVETRANQLLPSVKELLAELDSMEHSVRARLAMATPAEPASIDKAIAQQKVASFLFLLNVLSIQQAFW